MKSFFFANVVVNCKGVDFLEGVFRVMFFESLQVREIFREVITKLEGNSVFDEPHSSDLLCFYVNRECTRNHTKSVRWGGSICLTCSKENESLSPEKFLLDVMCVSFMGPNRGSIKKNRLNHTVVQSFSDIKTDAPCVL